jgi:hypothetical protein
LILRTDVLDITEHPKRHSSLCQST